MLSHPRPDRFEFRRVLGKGGVGEVLLTWDRERGEEVALKSLRLSEVEADLVEAEKNGARLQADLARVAPHVPRVFEEGEDSEFYYFAMEYVAGKDLSTVVAQGPLKEDRAVRIAIQLYDFLARLHSFTSEIGGRKILGIIHGDIKPENVRLQEGDRVRVIDFGIAKQLSLSRSFTKNAFGSLPYLPPERLEHGSVDIQSDLWAAAVVLYSMVSGRLPYTGTTEDTVLRRIRAHDIVPLPDACSRSLQWIVNKSLSFEVERRFSSAAAVKQHLESLRDTGTLEEVTRSLPIQAVLTRASQPAQSLAAPPEAAQAMPDRTRRTAAPPASSVVTVEIPRPAVPPPTRAPEQAHIRPPQPPPARVPSATGTSKFRWQWLTLPLVLLAALALFRGYARNEERPLPETPGTTPEAVGKVEPRKNKLPEEAEAILTRHLGAAVQGVEDDDTVDWNTAIASLETAVEADPQNQKARGMLRFSEGQLALTQERRAEAVTAFEDAARLDERWPHPILGLARALADGSVPDKERFKALQARARERFLDAPELFAALLADAYLVAGKRLLEEATGPTGGAYDLPLLQQAFRNLEGAVRHYEIAGDSIDRRARLSEALELKNRVAGLLANM